MNCDRDGVLTSFNIDNSTIFSDEKKYNEAFRSVYFLRIREKNFKLNVVLVIVLVLKSKGFFCVLLPEDRTGLFSSPDMKDFSVFI